MAKPLTKRRGAGKVRPSGAPAKLLRLKKELNRILSDKTGKPLEKVAKDSERDFYMSSEEALAYGLIDRVVSKPVTP